MSNKIYSHPEMIKTVYFLLKNAYLTGNKEQSNFFVSCMKKIVSTQSKELILKTLNESQIKDIKNIIYCIQNNIIHYDFKAEDSYAKCETINRVISGVDSTLWFDDESKMEKEICKEENFDSLKKRLDIPDLHLFDVQHETQYGKIDLLCQSGKSVYIIELKKDVANHKIVGQVLKYALHFQRRLIYELYDDVKIITIAGNYTDYCYTELKRLGITTLIYSNKNNCINFYNI